MNRLVVVNVGLVDEERSTNMPRTRCEDFELESGPAQLLSDMSQRIIESDCRAGSERRPEGAGAGIGWAVSREDARYDPDVEASSISQQMTLKKTCCEEIL